MQGVYERCDIYVGKVKNRRIKSRVNLLLDKTWHFINSQNCHDHSNAVTMSRIQLLRAFR